MKTSYYRALLLLFLIAMISLACLIPSQKEDQGSTPSNPPAADTSGDSSAAKKIVYEEGGFQFSPLPDWEITCAVGIIQMKAPDADMELGPAFLIMAGDNDEEMTTEEAFEKFKKESTGSEVGKAKKVKVGGFPALQAELTTQQSNKKIKAIVLTSMLTAKRQFTMMASAPAERWEDDIAPYFEEVRDSIQFITIVPDAGCPAGTAGVDFAPEPGSDDNLPESDSTTKDGLLRQWAVQARASSQYGDPDWAASQATGEPDVENCEDSVKAWASASPDTKDWIELTFATPVYPTEINVHMNYNPSQVVEIQIIDVQGKAYTVIETEPEEVSYCPDVYQISLELTKKILVDKVKIFIDQTVLNLGWNEIDAVELVGLPEGVTVPPPAKPQSGSSSGGSVNSPYQPDDLASGAYAYDVSGYENDSIKGSNVQYQSTENTYVVGLISGTERYIVSLFLPKTGLKKGVTPLIPYDQSLATKNPTAAIYINAFLYIADSGEIDIQSDPATGKLTGVFYFKAHSKDFSDRSVEVTGAIKDIPLK
ncbi:MAG: hypothetical protein HPY59_17050 [Anaerolineae bacterium]|nr:hypothetical protein [Anaerolineae bacterium]